MFYFLYTITNNYFRKSNKNLLHFDRLKHHQLLADIKRGVLGKYRSHVCTIEFQKRGLPHAHYLFIMDGDKPTSRDIDDVVAAELPDPNKDATRDLHDCVKRYIYFHTIANHMRRPHLF